MHFAFCTSSFQGVASSAETSPPLPTTSPPSPATRPPSPATTKYTLRYKFRPGETLRWKVVDETKVETTVAGTTQLAEAHTESTTVWRIGKVEPDGTATFDYLVESVQMRQKVSGRMEMRYNSQTDKKAPEVFGGVAKTIGVPLTRVVLDAKGKVHKTEPLPGQPASDREARVALPLPDKPVAVKESWSIPSELEIVLQGGAITKVKMLQRYTLENVEGDVASIRVEPQILTPIDDPAVEAQLVQQETSGVVRFDLKAGRILGRKMEGDSRVVGFAGNGTSVLGYHTQFTAELLGEKGLGARD